MVVSVQVAQKINIADKDLTEHNLTMLTIEYMDMNK